MIPFRTLLAALVAVFAFGCAAVKPPAPARVIAKVVFVTFGKEIELVRDQEVRLGWMEALSTPGPDAPPTARFSSVAILVTAQWVGDTIIIKKSSSVGGDHKVETQTIELSKLPIEVDYRPAAKGELRIIYVQP